MSGRWVATNSPNARTGVGFVPAKGGLFGSPKGDMEEHDCQPSGSGGTWTCGCGRAWKWSEGSGFLAWGTSRKGKR